MRKLGSIRITVVALLIGFSLLSCNSFKTALFDQHSYQESVSLKVDAVNLMNKADEAFVDHQTEVADYLNELEKLTVYAQNMDNNELSYEMLRLIANPDKNLLGGFLKRWEENNELSTFFIKEAIPQIEEAFDVLIRYESKKDKDEVTNYLSK